MPQSVSDTSVSNRNEMRSPVCNQAEETPPEADNSYKAEMPEDVRGDSQHIRRRTSSRNNRANLPEDLKYVAKHFIKLFIPVSLCMLLVVATTSSITFYTKTNTYLLITDQTVDTLTEVWQASANTFILVGVLVCIAFIALFLYKFKFYKVIHYWLILSSLMILFLCAYICLGEIVRDYNIPMDYITVYIMIWNFGVVGIVCIHWKGPLILQQAYQMLIAAFFAMVLTEHLPNWTAWVVLGVISVWDLICVLCPKVKIFIETALEINEPIFSALINSSHPSIKNSLPHGLPFHHQNMSRISPEYSIKGYHSLDLGSSLDKKECFPKMSIYKPSREFITPTRHDTSFIFLNRFMKEMAEQDLEGGISAVSKLEPEEAEFIVSHILGSSDRSLRKKHRVTRSAYAPSYLRLKIYSDEEESVLSSLHPGFRDFVCFGVLVGKALSFGEWSTSVACFVAFVFGECLTLLLVVIFGKPLPFSAIPITCGSISYFTTSSLVQLFGQSGQ